jgi:hypothetical protein
VVYTPLDGVCTTFLEGGIYLFLDGVCTTFLGGGIYPFLLDIYILFSLVSGIFCSQYGGEVYSLFL